MKTITYNDSKEAKKLVLRLTGKAVDEQGYVIEAKNGRRVLSPAGEEVHLKDFAGIRKGSEIIITKDLPSLLEQADYIER